MPKMLQAPAKKRQPCIGDMTMKVRLLLRELQPPSPGETDFSEKFTEFAAPFAKVVTRSGKTFWDGVNQADVAVTHELDLYWRDDVDTGTWLLLSNGNRLRVLAVDGLDERGQFMRLTCTDRGLEDKAAAQL